VTTGGSGCSSLHLTREYDKNNNSAGGQRGLFETTFAILHNELLLYTSDRNAFARKQSSRIARVVARRRRLKCAQYRWQLIRSRKQRRQRLYHRHQFRICRINAMQVNFESACELCAKVRDGKSARCLLFWCAAIRSSKIVSARSHSKGLWRAASVLHSTRTGPTTLAQLRKWRRRHVPPQRAKD